MTQLNGMGLPAPRGVSCSIDELRAGTCLDKLGQLLAGQGAVWSSTSPTSPKQVAP
jgi:hypothetical protein